MSGIEYNNKEVVMDSYNGKIMMMKVMIEKMNLMLMMARMLQLTTLPGNAGRTTFDVLLMLKGMMLIAEQNGEEKGSLASIIPMNFEEQAKDVAAASEEALPGWRKKRA